MEKACPGTAKVLCMLAPCLAGMAHLSMLGIGGAAPYPVVGIAAALSGVAGIALSVRVNRLHPSPYVARVYPLIGAIGIVAGAFYASIVGPLIVFFPRI
jgi:hypothetical protein